MTDPEMLSWLRRKISERLYLAQHAIELGNAAEWTELSSGVLMTVAPDAPQDGWDGVHPLGDSSLTRLMEANDPQDTIARCEAELGILDLYEKTAAIARAPDSLAQGRVAREARARDYLDAKRELAVLEEVVRLLAAGYRHHPGWAEAGWGP